jgi:hypothetical protein
MSTPPPQRDRRQQLLQPGAQLNGIDYVDVAASQTRLSVHFVNTVPVHGTLAATSPVTITGGEVITSITVAPVDDSPGSADWSADSEDRPVLTITVAAPGDFSTYQLTIASTALDPFFDSAPFSFKANCPTTLDCATAAPSCPEPAAEQVPIDYLAKDFGSFKQALSEFSALRYPAWVERSEADVGVVLMEALSAMADELSYYQDRVAAESTIVTATQRLSAVRHARLVDYEPAPATVATTVLQLDVTSAHSPSTSWTISTPLRCYALGADGSVIDFEIEDPTLGMATAISFTVDARWNRGALTLYYWDDSQRCLPAGSTSFYLLDQDHGLLAGQQLLLDSSAAGSADPTVRELVEVSTVKPPQEGQDQLFGQLLTKVFLAAPTTQDHDQFTTVVAGNIVPAVQGLRQSDPVFTIPDPAEPPPGPVVVRIGANSTPGNPQPDFRYCLQSGPLAWLATPTQDEDTLVPAQPEIVLTDGTGSPWAFKRSLLDAGPPGSPGQAFTLTPEQYSSVLTSNNMTWYDYDGDGGTTIRFGDGTFGVLPSDGTDFSVVYRVGGGTAGNVPADAIVNVAPGQAQGATVTACTNPFPATGGADAETITQVRTRAPQMFRAQPLRAVRAADYVAAAQSLPWVQQAGTTFRWTGSWLTVLTSADPAGSEEPTIGQLTSLTGLLDQRRLAGYESYVLPPHYVSIDLQITVCGQPSAFASDVHTAVLTRLQPGPLPGGAAGFFDHSQWGFGQALESSALLAAIQSCPGVVGVYQVQYRQRGMQLDWAPLPDTLVVAADEILRVDNDPSRPEAGSLRVSVEGSK